jgi:hypothetical protein
MNCDRRKVALAQEAVELGRTNGALNENDHLVVGECVEDIIKPSVLGIVSADLAVSLS